MFQLLNAIDLTAIVFLIISAGRLKYAREQRGPSPAGSVYILAFSICWLLVSLAYNLVRIFSNFL